MAKKKSKIEVEFSAKTEKFDENIKAMNAEIKTQRKELKLNATELKGDADNADLLAKRQKILAQEHTACNSKINSLNNKLDEAKRTFGDNSKEVKLLNDKLIDAKTQLAGVENEIKSTDSKLESLQKSTNASADEFDDLTDSVKKSGKEAEQSSKGGWSVFKQMLADFASSALDSLKEKFKEVAIEGERSLDILRAKTFANGAEMKKYESIAKNVYKNGFGDSFSDVTEAIASVIEMTGDLDDTTLQNVTQNAMTLNDVYDMDIKESMRAVNSMVKQFEISYEEAFDIIVAGTQNGLNQNDDFLDTLNEYSVQYKNAGYSARDMFNMFSNGAQTGTWSIDKLGDALKEYNIRMSDGTAKDYLKDLGLDAEKLTSQYAKGGESAKQATQVIINALKNTDDKQKQFINGQGIMGTMWEDLGADAVFSLVNTQGEIDATDERMSTLADDAYDNLGTAFQSIGATIETDLLQPVADDTSSFVWDLMPKLQGLISGLAEAYHWGKEHKGLLIGIASVLGVAALAFGVFNGLVSLGTILNAANATSIVGLVAAKWAENAANIALAASGMAALAPLLLIVVAIAAVIAIIVLVVKHFDTLKTWAIDAFTTVKNKCTEFSESVKQKFSDFGDSIVNGFKSIPDKIGDLFDKLKSKIKTPKISVTYSTEGTLAKVAEALGLQGFPKLHINWNKFGGVFENKTIVAQGFAEAGDAEMALPLNDRSTAPFAANIASHMPDNDYSGVLHKIYKELAAGNGSLTDKIVDAIVNRVVIRLNRREIARAEAK